MKPPPRALPTAGSIALTVLAALLSACGGSGETAASAGTPAPSAIAPNELPLVVDSGPAELAAARLAVANSLYASVTVCSPGSTSACQTIDHVLVDTGSVGLRILASALPAAVPLGNMTDPSTGNPLRECQQFVDGHAWGSVAIADVQMGTQRISSLPVQLIGDTAAGTAPASCVSGRSLNSISGLAAKGILGVGHFLQDCGSTCAVSAIPGSYYVCPLQSGVPNCRAVSVALERQVRNPVGALAGDNNGLVLKLPAVPSPGARSLSGSLFFGVGTQANNTPGNIQWFTLDPAGTLVTSYGGTAEPNSFIDSGSNGFFFNTSTLPRCTSNTAFYCPATSTPQTAQIQGLNGTRATLTFTVDNAEQLFQRDLPVLPGLAGTFSGGASGPFDWGLPFFYGRPVYMLLERQSLATTTGPAVGF